ncbi:MAG: MATE family efflux transporter [Veillonella sp.]|uniref:MATE family efflux transporter n=1 Tax=Veillonella sp. TaxID=1926307 RepID=UPI0025F84FD0|nr:MATE family efflux transporter [Veillonella sp.]MBS4914275.1 MATE family efflux transporter [Veillonella sp.]
MRTPTKSASLSVVSLSWPIFIEIFLQMLIGNIDQFMMSHYSQEAVAAVANANQVMNIFIMLIIVMSTASTILIAQYLGAKNPDKINEVTTVSIAFNFVFSACAALFIIVSHRWLFAWLGVPEEVMEETSLYMSIVAFSIPITGVYTAFVAAFRGFSLPIITMCVAFVMNVFHIISNVILIFGWAFIPSMGVLGVSISTLISKAVGLALVYYLFKTQLPIKLSWSYLKTFPKDTLKRLLHISVPSGGETLSYQLSQTTIMKMVNIFGIMVINTKVYAYIISMFCYMYTIALANAAQIIVGFLVGADREDEISNRVWRTMWLGMAISIGLSTTFYLLSDYIFAFFTDDPEIISLGKTILFVEIFLEIGRSVNIIMVQCLQAAGDIRTPMIVGVFGMWLCAVNLSYILGIWLGWGLVGIWIAMAIDEGVRAIIFVWRWHSGKWKNRKLIEA